MDLYQVLGVPPDSTSEYIKQKFRILAQQLHPDKTTGNEEKFKEIKLAYEVLIDTERRKLYDETGKYDINPTVRSEALEMLSQIILNLIPKINPDTEDLILKMKIEVAALKKNAENDLVVCNNFITNLNKVLDKLKLKNKDGENILKSFVNKQLDQRLKEHEQFTRRVQACTIMEELLNLYYFSYDDWILYLENFGAGNET